MSEKTQIVLLSLLLVLVSLHVLQVASQGSAFVRTVVSLFALGTLAVGGFLLKESVTSYDGT